MKPLVSSLLLSLSLAGSASAANLVSNPGFEAGVSGWSLFIPQPDNANSQPVLSVVESGARTGKKAAQMFSAQPGRFALGEKLFRVKTSPLERIRIAVWYRGQLGATVKAGTPGPTLRVDFTNNDPEQPVPKVALLFANAAGALTGATKPLHVASDGPVDQEWTKIEVIFEVPAGANRFGFGLFAWGTTGGILVDDFECEKVPATTALTPFKK